MGLPTYDPRDLDVDGPDLSRRRIAYFSMEIALSRELPTYSGGLGMLAGDTLRSAADMAAPMVAVSLVHRRGYFRQNLDAVGQQTESPVPWSPETTLPSARQVVSISMQGRKVAVCAWRYDVKGDAGYVIPVFLLDTDLEGNDPYDRRLTDTLYGGDTYYRLCQEAVLGLGGVALLRALGAKPEVFHINEGHAALLGIGLLEERLGAASLDLGDRGRRCGHRPTLRLHHPYPGARRKRPVRHRPDVRRARRRARQGHRTLRIPAQCAAQHDLSGAALLALCQRRFHAAWQGLAGDVFRLPRPRPLHHQRRPCGYVDLKTLAGPARRGGPRVAARQPVLPFHLRRLAHQDRQLPRPQQAAPAR